MQKAIAPLSYYFTVPRVSKWAIFIPAPLKWLPGDKSVVVASEDYYVLGILTSKIHRLWMEAQKSTLKADIAYTHKTCFETFPFPQTPSQKIVQQIRNKTIELHQYRTQQMEKKQWGITKLYNEYFHEAASKLYQLHQQLDKLVMQAYKFKADDNILEKLLTLNFELAESEKQGEIVLGAESPYKVLENVNLTLAKSEEDIEEIEQIINTAKKLKEKRTISVETDQVGN